MSDLETPDEAEEFKSSTMTGPGDVSGAAAEVMAPTTNGAEPAATTATIEEATERTLHEEPLGSETLDDLPTAPEDANVSLGEITLTPLAEDHLHDEGDDVDGEGDPRPTSRGLMADSEDPMLSSSSVPAAEEADDGGIVVTSITDSVEVEEDGADFSLANVKMEPASPPPPQTTLGVGDTVSVDEPILEEEEGGEGVVACKDEPLSDGPRDIEVPCHDDGQLKGNYTSGDGGSKVEVKREKKKKYSKKKRDKRKKTPVVNLFGRRTLLLRARQMVIHPKCMLPNGKVNLKELRKKSPELFEIPESNVYFGDWTPERDAKKKKVGRPPKIKEEPVEKKKRGRKPKVREEVLSSDGSESIAKKRRKSSGGSSVSNATSSKKVKSLAVLDSSSDDSELEMMRKKHMKTSILASSASTTSSTSHQAEKKAVIESEDENEGKDTKIDVKKSKESSAMSELKKLITEKEKEKSEEKPPEKVKEVLVEKLFNLISGDDKATNSKETKKDELESPQSPSIHGDNDADTSYSSETLGAKKADDHTPARGTSRSRSCEKGPINLKFFESTYDLRRFRKTILMEFRDDADFLSKRHPGITLKEFEARLVEAVSRIDRNIPVCPARPPPVEKDSRAVRELKKKFKIRKELTLKVRDVKFSSRYRKRYAKALPYVESGMKRKTRQRKEGLLQGLKVVKKLLEDQANHGSIFNKLKEKRKAILSDSDSDGERDRHKSHKKSHRDRDHDDDPTKIGGFKIPRKDKKAEAKAETKSEAKAGMKSILKSEERKKSDIKTNSYNHSYGGGKKEPHKRIRGLETNAQTKQISFDAFQVDEKDNFNVLNVVKSMKSHEKDKEQRKKDLLTDPKLRDAQNKLGELKAKRPNPPAGASSSGPSSTDPLGLSASADSIEPVIETFDDCPEVGGDEELEEILSRRVQDVSGRIFNTVSARVEEELIVFKCWVCDARIDGKNNLVTHLAGFRHHGSSKKFKEVAPAPINTRPQRPPKKVQEKAPPVSTNNSENTWGPGGPKIIPKHRKRDAEQKRRGPHPFDQPPTSRPRSPMEDGHDDGAGYSPFGGGGDDHLNNSPSPPPPSRGFGNPWDTKRSPTGRDTSGPSTSGMPSLFLPKPVSSLSRPGMPSLPKPVPAMTLKHREEEEEAERRRRMEMLRFETGGQDPGFGSFTDSFSGPPSSSSRNPAPFGDPFENRLSDDRLRGRDPSFGRFEEERRRERDDGRDRFGNFGRFDSSVSSQPSSRAAPKDPDDEYFDMRPYEERMRDRAKRMKELEERERMIRMEEERLQSAIQAQKSGLRKNGDGRGSPTRRERDGSPAWDRDFRNGRPVGPVPPPHSGFDQPPVPVPVPVPAPGPTTGLTRASLSVADLEKLPKPLTMAEKVAAHLETQQSDVDGDWQRAREARTIAHQSRDMAGSGSNTPIGNRSAVSAENMSDMGMDNAVGDGTSDDGLIDKDSNNRANDAYNPASATPLWEPTQAEKSVRVPKGAGFSDFNIDPTKSFLDSGFSADAAASALREKEEKKRRLREEQMKSAESEKNKKSSDHSSGGGGGGGLQIKSLSKLMANPEKAAESDSIKQNFNSFLNQVIKTLSKDKQPGASAKKKSHSLQLPSLDQEEDDTPPMPASDDEAPRPPLPSSSHPASLSGQPDQPPPPPPEPDTDPQHSALLSDPVILRIASEVDPNLTENERMIRARERISQYLLAKGGSAMPHAPMSQTPFPPPVQHTHPPFSNPMGPNWGLGAPPPPPSSHGGPPLGLHMGATGGFYGQDPYGAGFNPSQPVMSSANRGGFSDMLVNRPPPPPPPSESRPAGTVTDNDINDFMSRWGVGDSSEVGQRNHFESREQGTEEPKQFSSALAKLRAKKAAKKRQEEPTVQQQEQHYGANRQSQGEDRMSECSMASAGQNEGVGETDRKRKVTSDDTREKLKRMRMELEGGVEEEESGDRGNPLLSLETPAMPDMRAVAEATNSQRSQLTLAKEIANKVHQDLEHEPSISEFLGGYYEKQNEMRNPGEEGDGQ